MIDASGTRTPTRPSIEEHARWCDVPEHLLARRSNPVSGAESVGCIGPIVEFGKIAGWLNRSPELRGLLGVLLLQAGQR